MALALEGIKILDLSRQAPGPYCTMLLGDMGADILRIEEPPIPQGETRRVARFGQQPQGQPRDPERALAYNSTARNKRSMVLNLREQEGREILYKLCETADVVLEGFRPGVVKRLGVDYETVSKINPRIVYCSLSGFGQTGPFNQVPGHDINYISLGGALALIGNDPEERPAIPLNFMADLAGGGASAAFGILCALMARERTGKGQTVDVGMSDGVFQIISGQVAGYLQSGSYQKRGRQQLSGIRLHYNTYRCKDGKWISIGSLEPWFYENFCRAIGREDWLPHEYADDAKHKEMIKEADQIFAAKNRDEWVDLFLQSDICFAPVLDLDDLVTHPHSQARNLVLELDHPKLGKVKQPGFGVKLSDTPGSVRRFAASTGEHTEEVLKSLGYAPERISQLKEAGVVV